MGIEFPFQSMSYFADVNKGRFIFECLIIKGPIHINHCFSVDRRRQELVDPFDAKMYTFTDVRTGFPNLLKSLDVVAITNVYEILALQSPDDMEVSNV